MCAAVLSAAALSGCATGNGGSDATTASEPPVVESSAAPTSSTPASAAANPGDLGVVAINQTILDEDLGSSVTVEAATTVWVPAIATSEGATSIARMVGIRISTDASNSNYLASSASPDDFYLVASDGTSIRCTELLTSDQYLARSEEILAALGGDTIYTYDAKSRTGEGWFPCMTRTTTDAAFDTPGYTIHYERPASKTGDGTVLPAVTADIPVA